MERRTTRVYQGTREVREDRGETARPRADGVKGEDHFNLADKTGALGKSPRAGLDRCWNGQVMVDIDSASLAATDIT